MRILVFPSKILNYSPWCPLKRFARKYVEFIGQRDVVPLLAVALLARMPVGMIGFAMVMYLREALGDFTRAGAAVGIEFVGVAVAAPIVGRIVDRTGARIPLIVTGLMQPLALTAVLVSAKYGKPFWMIAASAAIAGLFAPPVTTLTRTAWRHRFEHEDDRRTAFALDAVMIEMNFTVGPAIVATILATAGRTAAFATTIVSVVVSAAIFLASPAMRYFGRGEDVERHLLGPLTEPRLWLLFTVTFGITLCFGQLEVGYPAYATALAMPAFAGVLLAVNSLGSALGGAIFGGLHPEMPVERQLAAALALMSIPVALHAFVGTPVALCMVAFAAGAFIAPSIACQSVLVSRLAPSHYATEAFTWSGTFILTGLGAGMSLGGYVVEHVGLRYVFILGAVVVAVAALVALQIGASRAATARA